MVIVITSCLYFTYILTRKLSQVQQYLHLRCPAKLRIFYHYLKKLGANSLKNQSTSGKL